MNYSVTTIQIATDEMIETVIEMAGYGIAYWATAAVHDDEALTYTVTDEADGQDPVLLTTTYQMIAEALVGVANGSKPCRSDIRGYAARALAENDPGDIDSELADVVVQYALFGKIVYG